MRLSPQTHSELESFFRHFLDDETIQLPKIEIYIRRGAGLVTRILGVDGITIGRHIFIRPAKAKYNSNNHLTIGKNLLSHEVTHVLQYQKFGFIGFLAGYLKEYFAGLKRKKKWDALSRMEAYFEISHEIEARKAAAKFVEWYFAKR